jgi:hypothetical protein
MDEYGQQHDEWSANSLMLINYKKTKEMVLCGLQEQSFPPLLTDGHIVGRVGLRKLLGVPTDMMIFAGVVILIASVPKLIPGFIFLNC